MPVFTMRRALRENGVTAVSIAAISSALALVVRVVAATTLTLSLETELMALSVAWVGLYRLQRVLVGKRRCSGHWLVQYGAMAAYYLPTPLVFYAASAVCSTSHIDESIPWLLFGVGRMFCFSVPVRMGVLFVTNMRAYSLRDRPRGRYNVLMWLVFLGWVEWEWARRFSSSNWPGRMQLVGHICIHFGVLLMILFDNTSESTLDCQTKAVADYMKRESSKSSSTSSPFFDDDDDANSNSSLQLDCCRYPFVQRENGEWVTVKDLFHQCPDLTARDKDICLSYGLCRLLARRYYGFHCAEEGDDTVRRFALADLGRGDGYKRAFKTVEVQLAFLHDYFFTFSLPIIELGYTEDAQPTFVSVDIMFIFLIANLKRSSIVERDMIHMLVIVLLGMLMSLFETLCGWLHLPVLDLLAIYWRPIHTAFRKLSCLPNTRPTTNCLVRLFRFRPRPNVRHVFDGVYWRNKIGQYSILQDYDRRPSLKKALVAWFQGIMLSQPSYKFIKHLPVEEEEVYIQKEEVDTPELDSMRKLVADTLRDIDGPPTNGTRSLKINMDEINRDEISRGSAGYDWLLTCKQETHTDTILIWHIATCYCDMSLRQSDRQEGFPRLAETDTFHKVATTLSRYCTYLVAFLPEFLPEHSLTTKQVFQRVLQEAQGALGMTPMEEKKKYIKMQGLLLPLQREQQTTFQKGVELGRQLEMLDDTHLRWKVMAEFWAETILYVAPSDDAEAHIERLAKGGEFITHLWALLSNAGILKRATGECYSPPASTTTKGPPTHQLTEALSSSNDEASTSTMPSPSIQTLELSKQLLEDHD